MVAELEDLPAQIRAAGIEAPAVIVIGDVVGCREQIAWFERLPLFGRRVLVARASGQGAELALELRRRAAEPVIVPLLELVPAADPAALSEALARASTYDWIVYTSANAVRFATPAAESLGRARVACIGEATAREARSRACASISCRTARARRSDSPRRSMRRAGSRVAASCCRARSSRATCCPARSRRAARASTRSTPTAIARPSSAGERLAAELALGIDAVLLTSPSTVEHLFALLAPAERAQLAARVAFACIGPTTADALARALGGLPARAWTAQLQNTTALVDALERGFAEESHGLS